MTVIDDDTNRWENQMAALTEFLKGTVGLLILTLKRCSNLLSIWIK